MLNKISELCNTYRMFIMLGLAFLVFMLSITCIGLVVHFNNAPSVNASAALLTKEQANEEVEEVSDIYVDIKGAVIKPGVFKMKSNERVIDVITRAGGLMKDADTNLINLSRELEDQMIIIVYTRDEVKKAMNSNTGRKIDTTCVCPEITNDACLNPGINGDNDSSSNSSNTNSQSNNNSSSNTGNNVNGLININTADQSLLETLPGIGPARARDIVNYRRGNPFITIEDIKKVSGIGDATFANIKDLITV